MSGVLGDVSSLAGPALAALAGNPGNYSTIPAGPLPPALYSLALRNGSMPFIPYFIYTFPISPSNIRKSPVGMGNFYDVAGPNVGFGVQRIPDVYGMAPPVYRIAGTTGVKYHSTDRFLTTGLQSILILQAAIAQYFSLVSIASQGGATMPRMEFYDFFAGDFYQVVPLGPQEIIQDASRPQLVNYQFHLVTVQSLFQPLIGDLDGLLSTLSDSVSNGIGGISSSLDSSLSAYSPFTPAGP